MRILALDPGAKRLGVAVIENGPKPVLIDCGIIYHPKPEEEPFQIYKLRLEQFWADNTLNLLREYNPHKVVNEIVPAVGGGNFVGPQSELAKTVVTSIHTIAYHYGTQVDQIAARTVQKGITGLKGKVTKPKVRNGVLALFPELLERAKVWTKEKEWDAIDAVAIGAVYLGFTSAAI